MIRVLAFGHIPSWAGGKQETGLANVIYQLAYHIAKHHNVEMILAATDVYQQELWKDELLIMGWTKTNLLCYALKHPFTSFHALLLSVYWGLSYRGFINISGYFIKMLFLCYAIDLTCPDVVHLHGMSAWLYAKMVPSKIKIVVTIHGTCGNDPNLPNYHILKKIEARLCQNKRINKIIFIAEGVRMNFLRLYGTIHSSSTVILNAYDSNNFFYITPQKHKIPTLCTVASLSDLKGQMRVLEGICASGRQFRYFCIGGDSVGMAGKLQSYADEHNIEFLYYGKKKPLELRNLLAQADYMIMPSSSEGFGISFLEAVACGVPVILPKNLPIAQEKKLINERNSILLEDCTAESISNQLAQIDKYHFKRENVAASILGFSWNEIAKQYVQEFKTICDL